jgi:hypothetical protein
MRSATSADRMVLTHRTAFMTLFNLMIALEHPNAAGSPRSWTGRHRWTRIRAIGRDDR